MSYFILAGGLIMFHYFYKQKQKKIADELMLEQMEIERLQALDEVKSTLYTDITHEFRTPLTVILGMVNQIKENPKDWYSEGLKMIDRNGKGLLRLVNQMLNLSKLEAGTMTINLKQDDVVAYLKGVLEGFQTLAAEQEIDLRFESDCDTLIVDFDAEKLKVIVSNLLSSAIKNTAGKGCVTLRVGLRETPDLPILVITVTESGNGISKEKLPLVFDRSYQADDATIRKLEGTAIDLALTQELVTLLGGAMSVNSNPDSHREGMRTTFEVRLPMGMGAGLQFASADTEGSPKVNPEVAKGQNNNGVLPKPKIVKPMLLIVENNPDVVRYLQSFLAESYQIEVAADGKLGIKKAIELVPDIIIAEAILPEVDGFELCETLKKDERVGHIPILLLTAKDDAALRVEGLEKGADAFVVKPFDKEELVVQLRKMVELRKMLHDRFANGIESFLVDERRTAKEEEFAKQLLQILETHYANEDFDIAEICHDLHLSRAQCYRKIMVLTGRPVAHLLRSFRLKKGKQLIETTDLNISQVALEVGFKQLAHFSHAFQQEYGISPSELRK